MDLEQLNQRLLAEARRAAPSDAVPYAFEKRIMARLSARPAWDAWGVWSISLWRAAAPCLAFTCLMAVWVLWYSPAPSVHFAQELEDVLVAGIDLAGTW